MGGRYSGDHDAVHWRIISPWVDSMGYIIIWERKERRGMKKKQNKKTKRKERKGLQRGMSKTYTYYDTMLLYI